MAVGLFWLCPLVVLMMCTLFMITTSAAVYPEAHHLVPDNDDEDDEESPGTSVRRVATGEAVRNAITLHARTSGTRKRSATAECALAV